MDHVIVRSAVIRVVFVVLVVLLAALGTAHASPAAPAAPAQPPIDLRVAGALFTPSRSEEGISWRAEWVLTPESAAAIAGGATGALRFAVPLGADERVEARWGVAPLPDATTNRVAGVLVDRASLDGRTITATVQQRVALGGAEAITLGAPVATGTALQIVDRELSAGARFEIETGRQLERRVGYVAPPGISHAQREEARRLTGYDARVTGAPLYIRGDDLQNGGIVSATLITPRARARHSSAVIGICFGAIVVALFAAVRKLRHAASVERADALLAAEVDALEPASPHAATADGSRR